MRLTRRLPLVALTGLAAGASIFGLVQKPADAQGFLSINIGTPGYYAHYDDYRYRHDYAYRQWWWRHERYERRREEEWRHEHWRHEHEEHWREERWHHDHDDWR